MTQQRGYILFITFSILALCTGLVSAFLVKGVAHKKFALALLQQEQMNQFALSTPAMAQSFLSFSAGDLKALEKEPADQTATKSTPDNNAGFGKLLLEKVLPVVNIQQKFNLKEIEKDFPVVVNLTFFCESGKININGLYDLVNKKFYDEGMPGKDQKVFATWLFDTIAKITEKPSLLGPFIEHMKQRKIPFNDVTELLLIKEFATCFQGAVFYEQETFNETSDKKNRKLYLTDIFTVSSGSDTIQPWLLSPSVCALLNITKKGSKQEGSEKQESADKKVDLSSFKPQADWKKDWDSQMKPLYDVSFDKIPESVAGMLAAQFLVTTFSVLATVKREVADGENNMMVRIFAILKQTKLPDDSISYDVIKIYQT